jgi:hypothetical protein
MEYCHSGNSEYGICMYLQSLILKVRSSVVCVLWHVDPLLSNDREVKNYTTAVAK